VCNMLAEGTVNTGSIEVTNEYGESNPVPIPNFIDNPCAIKTKEVTCARDKDGAITFANPGVPPLFPLDMKEKAQKVCGWGVCCYDFLLHRMSAGVSRFCPDALYARSSTLPRSPALSCVLSTSTAFCNPSTFTPQPHPKGEFSSMQMVVKVGFATPFPVKELADTTKTVYKVIVGEGDGNAEILNVTSCTAVVNGEQTMTVSKVSGTGDKEKFSKPKFNHVMSGILAGAFTSASTHIYVAPGEFDYCGITLVSAGTASDGNPLTEQVRSSAQTWVQTQPKCCNGSRINGSTTLSPSIHHHQVSTKEIIGGETVVKEYPTCGSAPRPEEACNPTDATDYDTNCWVSDDDSDGTLEARFGTYIEQFDIYCFFLSLFKFRKMLQGIAHYSILFDHD
jgi:hypothetical protein